MKSMVKNSYVVLAASSKGRIINGTNWNWKAFIHTIIVDWREICYYRIVRGL